METYEKNRTVGTLTAECTADYILADFEGDIKKILSASAKAIPAGHYTDNNAEKFGGIVKFDVLYVDSEGKLTPLTTTADYEISVPVDGEKTKDAFACVTVASVTARPSGPRKLGLRASLTGKADVLEEDVLPFSVGEEYETKTAALPLRSVRTLETAEREYAEKSDPVPGLSGAEILISGGDVYTERAEKTEDGVRVTGKVYLFSLLRAEDGSLFYVNKTIPYEELLRHTEVSEAASVFADAVLTSVSASAVAGEEENYVSFSCICEHRVGAEQNVETPVILDLYHNEYETEITCSEFRGETLLYAENGTLTATGEEAIPEDCEGMRDILYKTATAKILETEFSDNRLVVKGEACVVFVGSVRTEDEKVVYCHGRITLPFEKEYTGIKKGKDRRADVFCYPYCSDVKIDGDKLATTVDLSLSVRVTESASATVVTSAQTQKDRPVSHDPYRITVYYPGKGETVYDVAKTFHVPASSLAAENGLTETAATAGGEPLPKRIMIKG